MFFCVNFFFPDFDVKIWNQKVNMLGILRQKLASGGAAKSVCRKFLSYFEYKVLIIEYSCLHLMMK